MLGLYGDEARGLDVALEVGWHACLVDHDVDGGACKLRPVVARGADVEGDFFPEIGRDLRPVDVDVDADVGGGRRDGARGLGQLDEGLRRDVPGKGLGADGEDVDPALGREGGQAGEVERRAAVGVPDVVAGDGRVAAFDCDAHVAGEGALGGLHPAEEGGGLAHGLLPVGGVSLWVDVWGLREGDVPVSLVSQVRLVHHVVPLVVEQLVVSLRELVIRTHEVDRLLHPLVRAVAAHARVDLVPCASNLNIEEISTRKHRVENHLVERALFAFRKIVIHLLRLLSQLLPLRLQLIRLLVVDNAEAARLYPLVLAHVGKVAVRVDDFGNGLGVLLVEGSRGPVLDPGGDGGLVVGIHVVGDVEPVADGDFVRLDVSDVDDPELVRLAGVGEGHLLVGLLELDGVDPFGVAAVADVVEVL